MRTRSGLPGSLSLAAVIALIATPLPAMAQDADMAAAVAALEWREIGPTIMGGRIADIAPVESDPSTFYVATATGGLWKTINHGNNFESVFDDQTMLSIGDVTLAPSNPNVVWVGSGEPQNRQSSPWGMGVFRVHGRRPHLDPPGARGHAPHLPHSGPPAESGRGLRGGDGSPVGLQPRAWCLPDDGRRRDVGAGPPCRRAHGRDRPCHGSGRSEDVVRGHVPAAADVVGLQRRRAGQRHLPDDGWRRQLDEARRRPAGG